MAGSGPRDRSAAQRLFDANPATLIVVAHPDDEIIGAAAVLLRLREKASVLHVTDGAPRNLEDAARAGFTTAAAYARARREEARASLRIAGATVLESFGIADQTACRCLTRLTHRLTDLLKRIAPDIVVTHAFEGGHPDHDAVAFAAAHAARACGIALVEMCGYFDDGSGMVTGCFAPPSTPVLSYTLNDAERQLKQRMLACHRTQARTLAQFDTRVELYRPAPAYDFTSVPNGGRVLYDRYDWGLRSSEWPALAGHAQTQLEQWRAA